MAEEALSANLSVPGSVPSTVPPQTVQGEMGRESGAVTADPRIVSSQIWNRWAPDALHSPLAPADLVEAFNRWQPDHLKIRR